MTAPQPKPWIAEIAAYIPGRSTTDSGRKVAKLSSNENPLGTSEAARTAFAAHRADLDRYPDGGSNALRAAIAEKHGLDTNRLICGTGSDELLHLAAGAYAGVGNECIYVRYGFAVYDIAIRRVGATPVIAPDRDYGTDIDALLGCVTDRTALVFLANPNNPTGTFLDRDDIARLHAGLRPDILLVLDHAYSEYLEDAEDDHGLELARNHPNVFVTRTFSKIHGLAAERIGWGYAHDDVITALNRIRAPFNVTRGGQAAAIAALDEDGFVAASRAHNAKWRAWLADEIAKLGGKSVRAVPSKANFLLVLFEGEVSGEAAYRALMERGFITRWLPSQGLGEGLRISIGTEEETRGLAAALREIVS